MTHEHLVFLCTFIDEEKKMQIHRVKRTEMPQRARTLWEGGRKLTGKEIPAGDLLTLRRLPAHTASSLDSRSK